MGNSWPVRDLEVVGYADSVPEGLRPRVVPPVFRLRSQQLHLFPPLELKDDLVADATAGTEREFQQFISQGLCAAISAVVPAAADHTLWIDEAGQPHYGRRVDVLQDLRKRALVAASRAWAAIRAGELDEATRQCDRALAADEECLDALLANAVIARLEGATTLYERLRKVTALSYPEVDFAERVEAATRQARLPATAEAAASPLGPPSGNLLDKLLSRMESAGASDLLLVPGSPPRWRLEERLEEIQPDAESLSSEAIERLVSPLLGTTRRRLLLENGDVDLAFSSGGSRFRANVFRRAHGTRAVFRRMQPVPTLLELGLTQIQPALTGLRRGLVLVAGPAGVGKTTRLAEIAGELNRTRDIQMMRLEEPFGLMHPNFLMSLTNFLDVGTSTLSFSSALRQVLRQDPDVALVGQTVSLLLEASADHLVLAELPVSNAAISSVIAKVPAEREAWVRSKLAEVVEAVVVVVAQAVRDREGKRGR